MSDSFFLSEDSTKMAEGTEPAGAIHFPSAAAFKWQPLKDNLTFFQYSGMYNLTQ